MTGRGWPLERVLFGINRWLYVATGACPASLLLTRLFHLRAAADRSPVP